MIFFPEDTILVGDAHQYLLKNYDKFDFIWSSPPCRTHSSIRKNLCVQLRGTPPEFPDLKLYEEILFLKHHFDGKWVVENVKPYYKPLILQQVEIQRHFFWSNFPIEEKYFPGENLREIQVPDLEKIHGFDLSPYFIKNKRQILRNCIPPLLGEYILESGISYKRPTVFIKGFEPL